MLLIGITGKAGAGKDTVGEILRDYYGFRTTSFAWPIKKSISLMLDLDFGRWDDRKWKEEPLPELNNMSPRYMAQTLGTEWGRELIDQDIWVKLAISRLENNGSPWSAGAITDVRFDNEANMIREKGILIHVHRDSRDNMDNPAHASEAGVTPYDNDLHVYNNGSIADLRGEVASVMKEIQRRRRRLNAKVQGDIVSTA